MFGRSDRAAGDAGRLDGDRGGDAEVAASDAEHELRSNEGDVAAVAPAALDGDTPAAAADVGVAPAASPPPFVTDEMLPVGGSMPETIDMRGFPAAGPGDGDALPLPDVPVSDVPPELDDFGFDQGAVPQHRRGRRRKLKARERTAKRRRKEAAAAYRVGRWGDNQDEAFDDGMPGFDSHTGMLPRPSGMITSSVRPGETDPDDTDPDDTAVAPPAAPAKSKRRRRQESASGGRSKRSDKPKRGGARAERRPPVDTQRLPIHSGRWTVCVFDAQTCGVYRFRNGELQRSQTIDDGDGIAAAAKHVGKRRAVGVWTGPVDLRIFRQEQTQAANAYWAHVVAAERLQQLYGEDNDVPVAMFEHQALAIDTAPQRRRLWRNTVPQHAVVGPDAGVWAYFGRHHVALSLVDRPGAPPKHVSVHSGPPDTALTGTAADVPVWIEHCTSQIQAQLSRWQSTGETFKYIWVHGPGLDIEHKTTHQLIQLTGCRVGMPALPGVSAVPEIAMTNERVNIWFAAGAARLQYPSAIRRARRNAYLQRTVAAAVLLVLAAVAVRWDAGRDRAAGEAVLDQVQQEIAQLERGDNEQRLELQTEARRWEELATNIAVSSKPEHPPFDLVYAIQTGRSFQYQPELTIRLQPPPAPPDPDGAADGDLPVPTTTLVPPTVVGSYDAYAELLAYWDSIAQAIYGPGAYVDSWGRWNPTDGDRLPGNSDYSVSLRPR